MSEKVVEMMMDSRKVGLLALNGNYKNPGKEDAVLLAEKFGLKKDETAEIFEEISKTVKQ